MKQSYMKNKRGQSYTIIKLIAWVIAAVVLVLAVANAKSLDTIISSVIQRFSEFLRFR